MHSHAHTPVLFGCPRLSYPGPLTSGSTHCVPSRARLQRGRQAIARSAYDLTAPLVTLIAGQSASICPVPGNARGHAAIEPKPFGSDLGTHSACTRRHGTLPDAPPDLQLPQPLHLPSPSLIPRFHHHYIRFHHPLRIHIILGHSPTIPVSPLHPQHISGCTSPRITIPCISTPFRHYSIRFPLHSAPLSLTPLSTAATASRSQSPRAVSLRVRSLGPTPLVVRLAMAAAWDQEQQWS